MTKIPTLQELAAANVPCKTWAVSHKDFHGMLLRAEVKGTISREFNLYDYLKPLPTIGEHLHNSEYLGYSYVLSSGELNSSIVQPTSEHYELCELDLTRVHVTDYPLYLYRFEPVGAPDVWYGAILKPKMQQPAKISTLKHLGGVIDVRPWPAAIRAIDAFVESLLSKSIVDLQKLDAEGHGYDLLSDPIRAVMQDVVEEAFLREDTRLLFPRNCNIDPPLSTGLPLNGLDLSDPLMLFLCVGLSEEPYVDTPTWTFSLKSAVAELLQTNTQLGARGTSERQKHDEYLVQVRNALAELSGEINDHLRTD